MHPFTHALSRRESFLGNFLPVSLSMLKLLLFIADSSPYTDARVQSLHPGICSQITPMSPGSACRSPIRHGQLQSKALGNIPLRDPDIPRFGITIRQVRLPQHSGCNDCTRQISPGHVISMTAAICLSMCAIVAPSHTEPIYQSSRRDTSQVANRGCTI